MFEEWHARCTDETHFAPALVHGLRGVTAGENCSIQMPALLRCSGIDKLEPPDPTGAAFDIISVQVKSISCELSGTYTAQFDRHVTECLAERFPREQREVGEGRGGHADWAVG